MNVICAEEEIIFNVNMLYYSHSRKFDIQATSGYNDMLISFASQIIFS